MGGSTALVGLVVILAVIAVASLRGARRGADGTGRVVVRCRDGHLFTTVWLPGASFKAIRLGGFRLQRCPVGDHWSIVAPVDPEDLTAEELLIASEFDDGNVP